MGEVLGRFQVREIASLWKVAAVLKVSEVVGFDGFEGFGF